jgi:hypothetical protein
MNLLAAFIIVFSLIVITVCVFILVVSSLMSWVDVIAELNNERSVICPEATSDKANATVNGRFNGTLTQDEDA